MITVNANRPSELLSAVKSGIKNGEIDTWQVTERGYFTHTPASGQWRNRAWFKPVVEDSFVRFNIIRPQGGSVGKETYAVYHGRFSEMLLAHFDTQITSIKISSLAASGDMV